MFDATSSEKTSNNNLILPAFTSEATPSISEETKEIFKKQNFTLPNSVVSLKEKVSDLEKTQAKLLSAKEHSTRDKIISLLAMMLAISIIVGGVLGTYYGAKAQSTGGAVAVAISPLAALFIAYGLTAFYNGYWSDDGKGVVPSCQYLDPIILPIIGPFIPVYQTFGNASRYQKASEQMAQEIQIDIEEAKKFFLENQEQSNNLLVLLKKGITELEGNLENAQKLSIKSPTTDSSLSLKIAQLKKAAEEFEAAITFFNQPNS